MKRTPHSVNVARLTYVVICELAGLAIALSTPAIELWVGLFGALIVAGFFIFVESLMKDFTLRGFSTATFGVAIGLICGFLLNRVGITDLVKLAASSFSDESIGDSLVLALNVAIYSSLAFLGAVLASCYFFAWISHFFIEHNRPATFLHPVYSLCSDFQMLGSLLVGRIQLNSTAATGLR